MSIIEWPENERPREKLLLHGAKHLSDAELLAIFIHTGIPGKTALDLAREWLRESGTLKHFLQLNPHEIYQKQGLGKAKCALLKAAIELGRRYLDSEIQIGECLSNSHATQRFLANHLKNHTHEVFACLYLDTQNRLLHFEELFRGTLHEASVYPREVVKHALAHNAAKVIFAHNHPSGNPEPSQADQALTRLLQQALALVEIQVIDHIIVGHKTCASLAEMRLL